MAFMKTRVYSSFYLALLLIQIGFFLAAGLRKASHSKRWLDFDEKYHLDYISHLNLEHAIPVFGKTKFIPIQTNIHPELRIDNVQCIDSRGLCSLAGLSNEAFQPPLYYFLSLPAFTLYTDILDKLRAVRMFNLFLSLATFFVTCLLICEFNWAATSDTILALSWIANLYLIPSFLLGNISINNQTLEVLLISLFFLFLLKSEKRNNFTSYIPAGILLGLTYITKLTALYTYPLLSHALLKRALLQKQKYGKIKLLLIGLLPILITIPWCIFNLKTYLSITPNGLMMSLQNQAFNSHRMNWNFLESITLVSQNLFSSIIPRDILYIYDIPTLTYKLNLQYISVLLLGLFIFIVPVTMAIFHFIRDRHKLTENRHLLLLTGLPLSIALNFYLTWILQWIIAGRYMFSSYPAWFAGAAYLQSRYFSRSFRFIVNLTVFIFCSILSFEFYSK